MEGERVALLVSILMSVYNGEATLRTAVDSILAQTFTDFEFIICDDGSTDSTWEILCEYREKEGRIRILQNSQNLGLAASLNNCFTIAEGRYIARQDADDVSAPDRLERTLHYLQEEDAPYVGCGVCVFDDGGIWSRRLHPERITKHLIAQKNPFFHPTMLFKRETLEMAGGYRATAVTRRTEDYDLVMRLAAQGVIGQNLQEYLYYVYEPPEAYRRHTLRTRWCEVLVRWDGLHQMAAPLRDYIYLCKPLMMCMVPRDLLKQVKRLHWKKREREGAFGSAERTNLHT